MYKITWDKETGGVLLHSRIVDGTLGFSPRPVFFEELDLLKLNELGWDYPRSEEPLLWAINKQYFYKGELVFESKGANIYDAATVVVQPGYENLKLSPVNVKKMLDKNKEYMFLLESEAIEFIHETYIQYAGARKSVAKIAANQLDYEALALKVEKKQKKKMAIVKEDCESFDIVPLDEAEKQGKKVYQTTRIDRFLASFSGGKDSQVVLDLCTRAIPSTDFEVIYSDTGYELPPSLSLYEDVQKHYQTLYPDLKFSVAKNHETVLNYWDKIGTPSDTHRWCCAVMKTAPLYRMLKIEGTNKQAKVLTFDGVRAEESTRRSNYGRIGKGVKHDTVINARPILFWSSVEIFLYLLKHNLSINIAYRQGMTRVGCLICPFGSEWNEMVAQQCYEENVRPFLERVENYTAKAGVKDIQDYIRQGGWKRRASGDLIDRTSFIEFKSSTPKLYAILSNPKIAIDTFFPTLGKYTITTQGRNTNCELRIDDRIYTISIEETKKNVFELCIDNIYDMQLIGLIKRVLLKCTYCIQCETCEVECPTGALRTYPNVIIDARKCVHCHKCLDFHEKGCIAANSLYMTTGNNLKQANIDRYKNFGLREEWVDAYFIDCNDFWTSNHGLNENYQIPSLKSWLRDAGIIDDKNQITELGQLLADNRYDYPDLIWEIIWINLSYNSFIINWFNCNIPANTDYTSKGMEAMIQDQYPNYKSKTIHNAVYQLQRTLKESPIGSVLGQMEIIDKETFQRQPYQDLSPEALAYSIYMYAKQKSIYSLRISDFYSIDAQGGPAKEFAITKSSFEKGLRSLNSLSNRVLVAELNMGLDSITLREDLDPLLCLKTILK